MTFFFTPSGLMMERVRSSAMSGSFGWVCGLRNGARGGRGEGLEGSEDRADARARALAAEHREDVVDRRRALLAGGEPPQRPEEIFVADALLRADACDERAHGLAAPIERGVHGLDERLEDRRALFR